MVPDDIGRAGGFHIFGFEEESDEPLKGKPRTIRLVKTEHLLGRSAVSLTAVADYDSGERVIEQRVYRPDGTLSFHEALRYEADPRAYTIQILDSQGAIVSTRKVLTHTDGEGSTVCSASGQITERTRTRRDPEGRVIEAISEDAVRKEEIRMQVDYGSGQPEAHVTFSQDPRRDIHFVAGPEGLPPTGRRTVVQTRDAEGNWTSKATLERDPATGEGTVIASTERTITYYSD